MTIERRRLLTGTLSLAAGALVGVSTDRSWASPPFGPVPAGWPLPTPDGLSAAEYPLAPPGSPGLVNEALWQARVDEYLHLVTSGTADVVTHLVRSHREPDYVWDAAGVSVDDFAAAFAQIDNWQDTRDFRFMDLIWMLHLADGVTPTRTLSPAVIDAFETRLAANRWRYDDPLPVGRIDNQWFWSENHLIIGLCDEYLAGQRMPDRVFGITGLTGAEHMARSKPDILAWINERARFGFFEFHSKVYMRFNIKPLTMLAELADDPELIRAAGMTIDLCLVDVAAHNHQGSYAAPQGRVYDLTDAMPWPLSIFLFDDSPVPFGSSPDNTTVFLCATNRYRPPQTIIEMATSPGESLVRERHGISVDGSAPITENPVAPFGYDFDDPENLEFWWSQGGIGLWQMAEVGMAQAEKFRIWDSTAMSPIKALVQLNNNDPVQLAGFLQQNHAILNFGHLQEVNTYHWRNDVVALTSAIDYRFGLMRDQVKGWQAVLDERAVVYTTHPRSAPQGDVFEDDSKPGYWTGEASMPRSAQQERTAIHIYQPAWDEARNPLLWSGFPYRPFTHAFFPQDHFAEVLQTGNWTFGREGNGYIGLWSWRDPSWQVYEPGVYNTKGLVLPFDLVANGGPDNVWIVEVGDVSQGSFEDWMADRVASPIAVVRDAAGFTVDWTSPATGALAFGSTGPFTVDGVEQQLSEFARHDSPWGRVERLEKLHELAAADSTLALDFEAMTRTHTTGTAPPPTTTTTSTTTPPTTTPTSISTTTPIGPARPAVPVVANPHFTG